MYLFRGHIPNILRIGPAADRSPHAYKLAWLLNNFAYVSAFADAKKLTVRYGGAVHNNRCHRAHAIVAFPARLTLYQPGQQPACCKRHKLITSKNPDLFQTDLRRCLIAKTTPGPPVKWFIPVYEIKSSCAITVSYTHLDVYKRQATGCMARCSRCPSALSTMPSLKSAVILSGILQRKSTSPPWHRNIF